MEKCELSRDEIAQIDHLIISKTVEKGEFLLKEGEICNHSFFVEKGLLRFYALNEEGKENILQFATENWIVSDRGSAYFQQPSTYYIDAIEPTTVVMINQDFINKVTEINPNFRVHNERLLQNHIRSLYKRVSLLLGASAKTRYLDFIKTYPDVTLRVPQWMIASYLGVTPESLSRVRKALAKENFKPY
ncbi:Crp/Fnr family transcriptional regulator [Subsaxibacter sp. CAU 1640]|uniref:Crp/Fnr family transcriptional regulator n=1 Tax=Subsaxibacter sp. CAU 1640 TaxID=2933271 RepID=UPI002004E9CB|nr:Crp/Fnr family transcriptional regulator [Subsaxibacter sp. CAU 1640]MCK7592026.1 Crp/Fnr family transcriptional regulator [Subsaxibacter sp. CAU 1640]